METTCRICTVRKLMTIALGILTAVSCIGLAAIAFGSRTFHRLVQRDLDALLTRCRSVKETVVTEDMLRDLPAPMQRYLRYTGVVGRPMIRTAYVKQRGTMQPSPGGRHIPLDFDTYYSVNPPGFVWQGAMHIGPIPLARARDLYRDGNGHMVVKAGSLITVVNARGEEMDRGSMMRFLSEMPLFPTAFLGDNISFEPIDDLSVRVTFTDRGRSVDGIMHIDERGRLVNFTAQQWRTIGKRYELTPWSTPVDGDVSFEGLNLPRHGTGIWHLPDGEFPYIESSLTEVAYNTFGSPLPPGELLVDEEAESLVEVLV